MMTADGTGDDSIRLEGWPANKKYEFMDVDVDEYVESSAEAAADDHEEDLEPDAPDSDVETDEPLDENFDGVSNDPDEFDVVEEDPMVPEGFEAMGCPDEKKLKKLSGAKIMFRWDSGWEVGLVKNKHSKSPNYNYFIQYTESDGSKPQHRQGIFANNYYDAEKSPSGVWFQIKKVSR